MRQNPFTTKNTKRTKEKAKASGHHPRAGLVLDEVCWTPARAVALAFFVVFVSFVVNSFCQIGFNMKDLPCTTPSC